MWVDSHCHLYMLEQDERGLLPYFEMIKQYNIGRLLCVAVDRKTIYQVQSIAEQYEQVDCSAGFHPCDIIGETVTLEEMIQLASHPKVVAIGETGLDYYRLSENDQSVKTQQQSMLRMQIQAAKKLKKPLIIHTRAAQADTLQLLREEKAEEIGGVMHCFTEDWGMAQAALDLNFYISISGIVTFKNAEQVQSVAKKVPLDRLLIETDSPYLAPVPFRGKPNQPAYVRYVGEYIAELRGISFKELMDKTTENYFQLFLSKNYV